MTIDQVSEIFISRVPGETTLAHMINGEVSGFVVDRECDKTLLGNIYLGKVTKVDAGINSAFIDIGQDKAGYLNANDAQFKNCRKRKLKLIQELFKEGDPVLVQVIRDPSRGKGAKLSIFFDLVGQKLVLKACPMGIRISRKITNHETANGLRELMNDFSNFDVGFVVRSKSQFYSFEQIKNEAKELIEKKSIILSQKERAKSPKCLHVAADPIMAYLRDMEEWELQRIVVDNRLIKRKISDIFAESYQERKIPIEFVDCPVSVFESYGFEQKIIDLYLTTIELPSGGKIAIEETAACVAVDIDSGRYLGGRGEESSAFAVNQEAACEVARQIKLRNLSGQIIIDFLPMKKKQNSYKIQEILYSKLKEDSRCQFYGFSKLGLFELIRERVGESLNSRHYMKDDSIMTPSTTVISMIKDILRELNHNPGKKIVVSCDYVIYRCVKDEMSSAWDELLKKSGSVIDLRPSTISSSSCFDISRK